MASYHMTVKVGKVGQGAKHSAYICRVGEYEKKNNRDLENVTHGNMPAWAKSAADFWKESDKNERANGSVYREYEIALPRELTPNQRLELVKEFVNQEIGNNKAYSFAIHNPAAAIEGGEQPHAHIMFSERLQDEINRDKAQYFKRYNAKNPSLGGCKKDSKSLTPTERKKALIELRERFASMQNKHLQKHGHQVKVSHLSLEEQGINRTVEPHLGAKISQVLGAEMKAFRAENIEVKNQVNEEQAKEAAKKYAYEIREKFKAEQALKEKSQTQEVKETNQTIEATRPRFRNR